MKKFFQLTTLNRFLPFLLLLVLMACEKETEKAPVVPILDEAPACLLTEEIIDDPSSPLRKNIIGYVGLRVINMWEMEYIPEYDVFGTVDHYFEPEYDARGNIIKAESWGYHGEMRYRHVLEYNDINQLTKWTWFVWINGKMEEFYSFVYEYASPTQLKKLTKSYPEDGGFNVAHNIYEYKGGLMYKIHHYTENKLDHTTTLHYDDKKNPFRKIFAMQILYNDELKGYPFQHNIIKETITAANNPKEYVDYTATYTYNTEGFPLTQRRNNVGWGNEVNYTYTYKCR